jgi:hypothetical protein
MLNLTGSHAQFQRNARTISNGMHALFCRNIQFDNATFASPGESYAYMSAGSQINNADVHTKECDEGVGGAYLGGGGGFFITSAHSFAEFKNIPKSFNLNLPMVGIGIGYGDGKNFSISILIGPQIGLSTSNYNTETRPFWRLQ